MLSVFSCNNRPEQSHNLPITLRQTKANARLLLSMLLSKAVTCAVACHDELLCSLTWGVGSKWCCLAGFFTVTQDLRTLAGNAPRLQIDPLAHLCVSCVNFCTCCT